MNLSCFTLLNSCQFGTAVTTQPPKIVDILVSGVLKFPRKIIKWRSFFKSLDEKVLCLPTCWWMKCLRKLAERKKDVSVFSVQGFLLWLAASGAGAEQNTVTAGVCFQGGWPRHGGKETKTWGKDREFFTCPFLGSYWAGGMLASSILGPTSCSLQYLPEAYSAANTLVGLLIPRSGHLRKVLYKSKL